MKAVVYNGPNRLTIEDRPKPSIEAPTDAIVRVTYTTICGTDLHLLHNDIPCKPGCILGHEGVGVIDAIGPSVTNLQVSQTLLISCITSCGHSRFCRKGIIDGIQAEYVRIPHASFSLHPLSDEIDPKAYVMLSNVFPTAFECGIFNGDIKPGARVAILGAGPISLTALMILKRGYGLPRQTLEACRTLTNAEWFDVVIEAAGAKETFDLSQYLVSPGGTIASLGVHGSSCAFLMNHLWHRNICFRTSLEDTSTTPDLLKMVKSGILTPEISLSHTFSFSEIDQAYEVFRAASTHRSMKVLLTLGSVRQSD
ncbi:putative zinc-containing alcohol dehydrogenase [Aspergillus saccharolyticus JOP 1030-1]|uniref:Alcohol dehydrogenase n=1 Tax=Aspergillus saccharolyticus JOP 1030-1 TaxID=1450539 RepID=A0A318Z951_9EURO|nr:alcohol dehydrogenase [Aspergillus saccharolyticus JOP 1030-1]PYH42927.1 alcohol dehydrogenase [Aspergillus saccharolyticus JOP 1030-1]